MNNILKHFDVSSLFAKSCELELLLKDASPFAVVTTTLKHRIYFERKVSVLLMLVLIGFLCSQIYQNNSLMKQLDKKEAYLVPSNLSNIMRVRANALSDDQIFEFAEDYINNFTNLNYEDADVRIRYLTRYMHPSLRATFKTQMLKRIPFWKSNHVDQVFSFGNIESLKRLKEPYSYKNENGEKVSKSKTFYLINVWGTVRKYVDGSLTETYQENIKMKFTTASIKNDRSWMFEVWDVDRKTLKEIEQEKIIRKEIED